MLKNIRLPDILPFLEEISGLIQTLGDESFIYIKNVIWYTLERGESTKSKEVIELFSKLFEGRKEEVAKNLLLQGFEISIIESATGLSSKDLAKIQKNIRITH